MTIPTPTPNLIIQTMDSLLERQASASWMSQDVIKYIEHNKLLHVTAWPGWSVTLTPAGEQFISENGEGGDHKMPKFKFKLTHHFEAVYEVQDWGQPHHGKRVAFRSVAPEYASNGRTIWNYTLEEFERMVVDVVGYLHWDGYDPGNPPPVEFARRLNAMFLEQFNLARQRFPDIPHDDCFQLLGVAQFSLERNRWLKTDLPSVTDP